MPANLKAPPDMIGPALVEWKRLTTSARKAGHPLTEHDRALVTLYIRTWMMNATAHEHIAAHGSVIKWPNGLPGPSPQYKVAIETGKQLRGLLADLGCTPASRSFDKSAATAEPPPLSF